MESSWDWLGARRFATRPRLSRPPRRILAYQHLFIETVPYALGVVCDSVLQGLEKMHLITAASGVSNAVALLGILLVALLGGPFELIL
jgi:hypothetical protein